MPNHPPIPLAAVIGHPVAHSRSPALHGHWLERYAIAGHYIPLDMSAEDLPRLLRELPRMGFVGANVTIPHKETVLRLADRVEERAAQIGAANTLTFRDGLIHADNTDGFGFTANLRHHAPGWEVRGKPVAVFGAGGAARAIVHALLQEGASELRLANRTFARAEALAQAFGPKVRVSDWSAAGEMLEGVHTLVNTSALGMEGAAQSGDLASGDLTGLLSALPPEAVVTDAVYTPLMTPLLRAAKARGCTVIDGLGMLLYQAVPGFERWFGRKPEVDERARKAALGA